MQVCMHAGNSISRAFHTTGSLVSNLSANGCIHFVTATSTPCISLFKPVWVDALPEGYIYDHKNSNQFNTASLWWRHELLHRQVLRDYNKRIEHFKQKRDLLENLIVKAALQLVDKSVDERYKYAKYILEQSESYFTQWTHEVTLIPVFDDLPLGYSLYWNSLASATNFPQRIPLITLTRINLFIFTAAGVYLCWQYFRKQISKQD